MSEKEPRSSGGRRLWTVAGLALAAGLLAGAIGIYVISGSSGNERQASACPASDRLRTAIDTASRGEVAAVTVLDEPFQTGAIAFQDKDGKRLTLADFKGRSLLVNLWATWCVPCRAEMPALDALEARDGGEDFAVVPINVDLGDDDKPRAFLEKAGLKTLPLYRDGNMDVFNDLKTRGLALGLPISLLVDEEGCARAILSGPAEWASPDAARLIDALKAGGA